MNILAFDSSSKALSVALLTDGLLLGEVTLNLKKNHSTTLMTTIDFLMAQVGMEAKDLDRIAVAQGPGSYTGLRLAATVGKMLAFSLNKELVGLSSLLAIANRVQDDEAYVLPIIDARRGNAYAALYKNGQQIIANQPLSNHSNREIARILALLPQSITAPADITVYELVSLGRFPHQKLMQQRLSKEDITFIEELMRETNVWDIRESKVSELSGGQKQRVFITMILAQDSEIILLDEPTTYLDLAHQLDILCLLKDLATKRNKTIVYVIHDLNHAARFADNLVLVKNGKVVEQGTVDDLFTQKTLKECFGLDVTLGCDTFTKKLMITGVKDA